MEEPESETRWRKVVGRIKARIPPFALEFYSRTVDPDYGSPPKIGRDLYIYTFPLQMVRVRVRAGVCVSRVN